MERGYKIASRFAEHVKKDFERADKLEERVQELITRLEQKGKDPAPLEVALKTFEGQIAQGLNQLQIGQDILITHAGFDDNGSVLDPEAAHQTLESAREALKNAHQQYHEARHQLMEALLTYRKTNPPSGSPQSDEISDT